MEVLVCMEDTSPSEVATVFLERFSNGDFDEADDLIHPEGPLEGAGDIAMLFSILTTDFLATFILGAIPTEVTETTIIEEGPTTATIEMSLDIANLVMIETVVELRPSDFDETDPGDGRRDGWSVWNLTMSS